MSSSPQQSSKSPAPKLSSPPWKQPQQNWDKTLKDVLAVTLDTSPSSDGFIKVLPQIHDVGSGWDFGSSFEIMSKAGGLEIVTCIDSGSGINAISLSQLQRPEFKFLKAQKDSSFPIKVGNSNEVVVNKELLVHIQFGDFSEKLWFFVIDHLPVQMLIGHAAMSRLRLGIDGDDLLWKSQKILWANSAHAKYFAKIGSDLEFCQDKGKHDQTSVLLAKAKAIAPRSSMLLPLTLNRPELSPEGFFFPSES